MSELEKRSLLLEYKLETLARFVKHLIVRNGGIPKELLPALLPQAAELGGTQLSFEREGRRMPMINDHDTAINEALEWAKERLLD